MKRLSWLARVQIRHFAAPAEERVIYRWMLERTPTRIVEFGLGDCSRARRLIQLAQRLTEKPIAYTGSGPFEAAPGQMRLKDAFIALRFAGCTTKLVPGDAERVLPQAANQLLQTDLIVLDRTVSAESVGRGWLFVPRMLHPESGVFTQQADRSYRRLTAGQIADLVEAAGVSCADERREPRRVA